MFKGFSFSISLNLLLSYDGYSLTHYCSTAILSLLLRTSSAHCSPLLSVNDSSNWCEPRLQQPIRGQDWGVQPVKGWGQTALLWSCSIWPMKPLSTDVFVINKLCCSGSELFPFICSNCQLQQPMREKKTDLPQSWRKWAVPCSKAWAKTSLIDDPYLHIVSVFPLSKLMHVGEVNHPPIVIKPNTK